MSPKKLFEKEFDAELLALKELAAMLPDRYLSAQVVALSDSNVKKLFLAKLEKGQRYRGAILIAEQNSNEQRLVFDFDPAPESVWLISKGFLVIINPTSRRVNQIVDPFILGSSTWRSAVESGQSQLPGGLLPFTLFVPSNAPNVTVSHEALRNFKAKEEEFIVRLGGVPVPGPGPKPPPPPLPPPTRSSWGTETYCASPTLTTCPHYDDSNNDYSSDDTTVDGGIDD